MKVKSHLSDSRWIDIHSVNCYFCGELKDERDCINADEYNVNDGGSICQKCLDERVTDES
jgi:hypothetical protein